MVDVDLPEAIRKVEERSANPDLPEAKYAKVRRGIMEELRADSDLPGDGERYPCKIEKVDMDDQSNDVEVLRDMLRPNKATKLVEMDFGEVERKALAQQFRKSYKGVITPEQKAETHYRLSEGLTNLLDRTRN